jgi:hypothetical protein
MIKSNELTDEINKILQKYYPLKKILIILMNYPMIKKIIL